MAYFKAVFMLWIHTKRAIWHTLKAVFTLWIHTKRAIWHTLKQCSHYRFILRNNRMDEGADYAYGSPLFKK